MWIQSKHITDSEMADNERKTVVNARGFWANQGECLRLAAEGQEVILTSRFGRFRIVSVGEDDHISSSK